MKFAVVVGSLRKASLNMKLARALEKLAPSTMTFHYVSIGDLPLYNDDLWADPPETVVRFKSEIAAADAVLFIAPEYNRSVSPAIKNAIDWGSRPKGASVWDGKPAAVAGASPGNIGTSVGQAHLKYIALTVGMPVLPLPEVYLSLREDSFDASGKILSESTCQFLANFLTSFVGWAIRQQG
jgi:chromate reductase